MDRVIRRLPRRTGELLSCSLYLLLAGSSLQAEIATWPQPAIDTWFHQLGNGSDNNDPSLFTNFEPGAGFSQARSGTMLVAYNTAAGENPIPLVAAARYQINSITVRAMVATSCV